MYFRLKSDQKNTLGSL